MRDKEDAIPVWEIEAEVSNLTPAQAFSNLEQLAKLDPNQPDLTEDKIAFVGYATNFSRAAYSLLAHIGTTEEFDDRGLQIERAALRLTTPNGEAVEFLTHFSNEITKVDKSGLQLYKIYLPNTKGDFASHEFAVERNGRVGQRRPDYLYFRASIPEERPAIFKTMLEASKDLLLLKPENTPSS